MKRVPRLVASVKNKLQLKSVTNYCFLRSFDYTRARTHAYVWHMCSLANRHAWSRVERAKEREIPNGEKCVAARVSSGSQEVKRLDKEVGETRGARWKGGTGWTRIVANNLK